MSALAGVQEKIAALAISAPTNFLIIEAPTWFFVWLGAAYNGSGCGTINYDTCPENGSVPQRELRDRRRERCRVRRIIFGRYHRFEARAISGPQLQPEFSRSNSNRYSQ